MATQGHVTFLGTRISSDAFQLIITKGKTGRNEFHDGLNHARGARAPPASAQGARNRKDVISGLGVSEGTLSVLTRKVSFNIFAFTSVLPFPLRLEESQIVGAFAEI